ncbi:unnamed protein product [Acanthoscelides obtectus]|uniref:RWD domain-containing protein n=1 Tax=Acanthoscelides obtectus TaxID=200917 RepID=A0A9P0NX99_ACAOB|nr:unnamed protein product [Acanthoscelides obtectus]CAK1621890.1 RWD domain-containing protein 2B [Acanthoscelides obtectus]
MLSSLKTNKYIVMDTIVEEFGPEQHLTVSDRIENYKIQLSELESLQSTFCLPGEIQVDHPITVNDMDKYINGETDVIPSMLHYVVNIKVDDQKFEICITLADRYPAKMPEIYVRNHNLDRQMHIQLNKDWYQYVSNLERDDPCIFSAISWLQENAKNYIKLEEKKTKQKEIKEEHYVRYWIYSHHIYSKPKRQEILHLANELDISGFCMPGKPGIICIEGSLENCTDWWQTIKSMNWKQIFIKVMEEDEMKNRSSFRKFGKLQEMVFQNHGPKFNHMDMGGFYKYLEKHGLGYVFKDLFGVQPKAEGN